VSCSEKKELIQSLRRRPMGKRLRLRRVPGGCLHLVLTLTNRHIKSQVVDKAGGVVVVSAATVESLVAERIFAQGNGPGDGERPPGWVRGSNLRGSLMWRGAILVFQDSVS